MERFLGSSWRVLLTLVIGLSGWILVRALLGGSVGVAPKPAVFAAARTLDEAIAESKRNGTPVLAFVTADWCPPCQTMKRTTLLDTRVEAYLKGKTIPVYVDVDVDPKSAGTLGVTGIPATVVISGDTVIARTSGALAVDDYMSFVEAAVDLASKPEEIERLRAERGSGGGSGIGTIR
jgi:thioredoxin-like negative regulator of GroEL